MEAERFQIPLRMLEGNLDTLMENVIPCIGVSLVRDPASVNGVLLMIHYGPGQREEAAELGMKMTPYTGGE